MLLTVEMITEALAELPAHRRDLRRALKNTIDLIERGVPVKTTAPVWETTKNVLFVTKIDGGGNDEEDS